VGFISSDKVGFLSSDIEGNIFRSVVEKKIKKKIFSLFNKNQTTNNFFKE